MVPVADQFFRETLRIDYHRNTTAILQEQIIDIQSVQQYLKYSGVGIKQSRLTRLERSETF